jgi:hypothetical protein
MPRNYHEPSRTDQILKKYDDLQERLFNDRLHPNNNLNHNHNNNNLNYVITQHIQHNSPSHHHHHHHHQQHQQHQNHLHQNNHNHHNHHNHHNISEANSPIRISNGERSSYVDDDYLNESFDFTEPDAVLRLKWLDHSPRMSRLREHRQKRLSNKLEVMNFFSLK